MGKKKLKCWKKHFTYGKVSNGHKSVADSWKSKKNDLVDVRDGIGYVNTSIYPIKGGSIERNFKNRKEALKFAKSYMKKHDRC